MSNKLIFNLTIKIDHAVEKEWLEDLINKFLPSITDGKVILSSQINKLLLEQKEEDNTYAIQFVYPSLDLFKERKISTMESFLNDMDADYRGKYVYFGTMMEMVHCNNKMINNPKISLN